MQHKNYVDISRKKTFDTTITQMEIIPQCCRLVETCVTDRAIVDINVEKYCSDNCMSLKRKSNSTVNTKNKSKMVVPGDDPIRLKSKKYFKEKSRRQDVDSSSYSSSSASSISSPDSLPRKHVYSKKNKSVQCNIVGKESDSISTVQALLKRLRRKLKGNLIYKVLLIFFMKYFVRLIHPRIRNYCQFRLLFFQAFDSEIEISLRLTQI